MNVFNNFLPQKPHPLPLRPLPLPLLKSLKLLNACPMASNALGINSKLGVGILIGVLGGLLVGVFGGFILGPPFILIGRGLISVFPIIFILGAVNLKPGAVLVSVEKSTAVAAGLGLYKSVPVSYTHLTLPTKRIV